MNKVMSLNALEIRRLRQRLGWSLAEMARRMGCSTDLITHWEAGSSQPEPEAFSQLQSLSDHLDHHCERVLQGPAAEVHMELFGLGQLPGRDLVNDN